MILLALTTGDTHAGRFDPGMLSEQDIVELLFTPNDYEAARAALSGEADDACTWNSVVCNEQREIIKIMWNSIRKGVARVEGSINFAYIPPNIQRLELSNQKKLIGDVNTRSLPGSLRSFILQDCAFTGVLDLGNLPRGIIELDVQRNKITGIVHIENLPENMKWLYIIEKNVEGSGIHIGKLPPTKSSQTRGLQMTLGCHAPKNISFADEADRKRVELRALVLWL